MTPGPTTFSRLGLAACALAALLAPVLTGSVAEYKTAWTAGALLAICEPGAALIAAGAVERRRRPAVWVGVGLIAGLLSFIAIVTLAIPVVFVAVLSGAGGGLVVALGALLLGVVVGGWSIMRVHEIVWRRLAPRDFAA